MKKIILSFLVVAGFVSCSKENALDQNTPVAVQFNAAVATKTPISDWTDGTFVGIYMFKHNTDTIAENASNRKYTTNTAGIFSPATADQTIYYPMNNSLVDFIAYYPYSSSMSNFSIPISVATQTNQSDIDVKYATLVTNKRKTDPNVVLNFTHKLSKLVMHLAAGTGLVTADLTGVKVTIKGYNTTATMSLQNGVLSNYGNPANIIPLLSSNFYDYETILLPTAAVPGAKVEFELASGEIFVWDLSSVAFLAGARADYKVTLKRTGAVVSGTITDWTTGAAIEVVAE